MNEDLKTRIDRLQEHDLKMLDRWLSLQEQSRNGDCADCFVIMPFSSSDPARDKTYWKGFFTGFLKPVLKEKGYNARRSEGTPGIIIKDIINDLAWTELVVAVLTDRNVNVWYELGVRHSLRRGATIMICQEDQIEKLPFDLQHHGVVAYTGNLDQRKFSEKLTLHLEALGKDLADSPVSEFAHSGVTYCIHRALSALRLLRKVLPRLGVADAESRVKVLNEQWRPDEVQVTVIKGDVVHLHRGEYPIGGSAYDAFPDMVSGRRLYAEMKATGEGLRLGSISGIEGRLTAFAFAPVNELDWFLVVEAHVKQAAI